MHKTPFAGLTELDPGDPITVDGGSFTNQNPTRTDYFLRIGAVTHRHDAHAQIPDPAGTPSASVTTTGGQIPGGLSIYTAYTLVDSDGGETRRSNAIQVTTPAPASGPSAAIGATFDSSAGNLPVGQFIYALTLNDGGGGETVLGPATFIQRPPGFSSGEVHLSNLAAELGGHYVSWNLWRAQDGGNFQILITGSTNTFTDTGLICTDASRTPPTTMSNVLSTNVLTVTLPGLAGDPSEANANHFNIYLSTDGSFSNPSLYGSAALALANTPIIITQLSLMNGAPPSVSLASQGANKIDPDTDMLNFPWKRPVANAAALPLGSGNAAGDARITLDDLAIHLWSGTAWVEEAGGGGGLTSFLASGADGSQATVMGMLGFAMAGGGSVHVQDLTGGSGVVIINASGAVGATGPQGPQGTSAAGVYLAGSGQLHPARFGLETDLEFVGSGGTGVAIQDLGGGSARILISASGTVGVGPAGPAGPTGPFGAAITGSAGITPVNPVGSIEFTASGVGVSSTIQDLSGGSARVLVGFSGQIPHTTQASGYVLSAADVATVVESASAGTGSASTSFIVAPFSQTGIGQDSYIEVFQYGTGSIQLQASGGVVFRSDNNLTRTAGQFATVGLRQRAIDEWVLSGDLG